MGRSHLELYTFLDTRLFDDFWEILNLISYPHSPYVLLKLVILDLKQVDHVIYKVTEHAWWTIYDPESH